MDFQNSVGPEFLLLVARLATNDPGVRGAGLAAPVCTPVIAAKRPIRNLDVLQLVAQHMHGPRQPVYQTHF